MRLEDIYSIQKKALQWRPYLTTEQSCQSINWSIDSFCHGNVLANQLTLKCTARKLRACMHIHYCVKPASKAKKTST